MIKKVAFLTGTRADFGKIKPLITILESDSEFEVFVFVTGMHLLEEYGYTVLEIERCNFSNVVTFSNHTSDATLDLTLAKTIVGFSDFIKNYTPDIIIIHGDRVEALAGAIVGSLNNILVAHIEGGEVSGTIDELIRHSTSKMSHIHFVSNTIAKNRLIQMGELQNSIFTIGSPDVDIMFSNDLPSLDLVKEYYDIQFDSFAIAMFHPVTTEAVQMETYAEAFVDALLNDSRNFIVVFPNNDLGSSKILNAYERLKNNSRFRVFPSLRFEYFLVLLKNSLFIIGNSSAGIREAPYYGLPIINIGSRQQNRSVQADIINVSYEVTAITDGLNRIALHEPTVPRSDFGTGKSATLFIKSLKNRDIWQLNHQKQFRDI